MDAVLKLRHMDKSLLSRSVFAKVSISGSWASFGWDGLSFFGTARMA
jgi:hypothetical protein